MPLGEFYLHPKMADGHFNFCRRCVSANTQRYKARKKRGEVTPRVVGRHAPRPKQPPWDKRLAKRGILVKIFQVYLPAGKPTAVHDRLIRIAKLTCQSRQRIVVRAIEWYLDFLEKKLASRPG